MPRLFYKESQELGDRAGGTGPGKAGRVLRLRWDRQRRRLGPGQDIWEVLHQCSSVAVSSARTGRANVDGGGRANAAVSAKAMSQASRDGVQQECEDLFDILMQTCRACDLPGRLIEERTPSSCQFKRTHALRRHVQ